MDRDRAGRTSTALSEPRVTADGILEHITRSPTALATAGPALGQRSDSSNQHVEARSNGHAHLLRNGAEAHELTREDRAKGGRARAEKLRTRKELRERFQVEQLEDLADAELELLDRALARLALLIASGDDRVAWRASKDVLDRVLGRPKLARSTVDRDSRAEMEGARQKLAEKLKRTAAARREETERRLEAGESAEELLAELTGARLARDPRLT